MYSRTRCLVAALDYADSLYCFRVQRPLSSLAGDSLKITIYIKSTQSHVTTDGQLASQSWRQDLPGAQDQIFVTVKQLQFCRCEAPSVTRGRVCHLQRPKSVVHVIYIYNFT
jgi:hypothetical protein